MSTLRVNNITDTSGGSSSLSVPGAAKAWVNFDGTGTVAIRAQLNVSSITDNGTGDYTVNFTTALADANYVYALATTSRDASGINTGIVAKGTNTSISNKTTSQLQIWTGMQTSNTFEDKFDINVAIFR
jgi:hypothetical protein